jgi:hypothetical protein
MMNNQPSPGTAAGDAPGSQPATSESPVRPRRSRRLWQRSVLGAAAAAVSLTALTFGAGAAHADTLPTTPTIKLGQYSIPATAPAGIPGGDALPAMLGTLGNPTELFMTQSSSASSTVLGIQGDSSAWGTPVDTETAAASPGQIWRFQLIGWIGVHTYLTDITENLPPGIMQGMPVYRIMNYHPDGTITCLDGSGGGGASGTMIDSYGCDPNQVNQTNQLWIIGNTDQLSPMIQSNGDEYVAYGAWTARNWLSSNLQKDPDSINGYAPNSVIENVASLQASGWQANQAPVLSASYTNQRGINSLVWLQSQGNGLTTQNNSTWLIHDTTSTSAGSGSGSGSGSSANCTGVACLFG